MDEPSPGNLRLLVNLIFTSFSLLMPAESLAYASQTLTSLLQRLGNAPLPLAKGEPAASVVHLSPVTLSVQNRLTSELLRFL